MPQRKTGSDSTAGVSRRCCEAPASGTSFSTASFRVTDAGLLLMSALVDAPSLDDDPKNQRFSRFQFDRTGVRVYFKGTNNMQYIASDSLDRRRTMTRRIDEEQITETFPRGFGRCRSGIAERRSAKPTSILCSTDPAPRGQTRPIL